MSEQNDRNKGPNPDEVTLKNAREILSRILAENENLLRDNRNLSKDFEVEKNIKNHLYAFILTHGMFDKLIKYEHSNKMREPGGHKKAVAWLLMQLPESTN
jgi:hypothetical protein